MRSNISFSVEVLWVFMGDIGSKIGLEDRPFVIKMCYGVRILRRISDSLRFLSGCKIYYSRETALEFKVKSRVMYLFYTYPTIIPSRFFCISRFINVSPKSEFIAKYREIN